MTAWQRSLDNFIKKHSSDCGSNSSNSIDSADDEDDILFIVSPASGGGNAMKLYPTCFEELKATGRTVEVYITQSSEDVITLSQTKNLQPYKNIVLLAGDSTLYEFIQEPLRQNNGNWPYQSTLLLLPGGSSNVIALEDFGPKACIKQIIRQTLSLWPHKTKANKASIKMAPIIQVTAGESVPRYSLHVCMTGFIANLIDIGERRRQDVYPLLGKTGWLLSMMASIPFMNNEHDDPVLLNIFNSDTEPNANFGFDNTRFDNLLTVIHIAGGAEQNNPPGKKEIVTNVIPKLMSGQLSKDWKSNQLPDYISVEKTNKYVYHQNPTTTASGKSSSNSGRQQLKFYSDGTSQLPFECAQDDIITFQSIPNALPFWTVSNKGDLIMMIQADQQQADHRWDIETVSVLSNDCQSITEVYKKLASPTTSNSSSSSNNNNNIQLVNGGKIHAQNEPLQKGDQYYYRDTSSSGSQQKVTVLESSITSTNSGYDEKESSCTFHVSLSSCYGLVESHRRISVVATNKKEDTGAMVLVGKVQEKCIKGWSWLNSSEADIRLTHRTLLSNLNGTL